jgi:hypothetical protein
VFPVTACSNTLLTTSCESKEQASEDEIDEDDWVAFDAIGIEVEMEPCVHAASRLVPSRRTMT